MNSVETVANGSRWREGITSPYVLRIVRLSFLSPQMLDSILAGTMLAHQSADRDHGVAARWDDQQS